MEVKVFIKNNILKENQKFILEIIEKHIKKSNFYLAGGTGLALQLKHRYSKDFDFFFHRNKKIDIRKLGNNICSDLNVKPYAVTEDELVIFFKNVKLQIIRDFYIEQNEFIDTDMGLKLATVRNIGLMKLIAVQERKSKNDFIDLFFICRKYSLRSLLRELEKKSVYTIPEKIYLLKSLLSFEKADMEPEPEMIKEISWKNVKKELTGKVQEIKNYFIDKEVRNIEKLIE